MERTVRDALSWRNNPGCWHFIVSRDLWDLVAVVALWMLGSVSLCAGCAACHRPKPVSFSSTFWAENPWSSMPS